MVRDPGKLCLERQGLAFCSDQMVRRTEKGHRRAHLTRITSAQFCTIAPAIRANAGRSAISDFAGFWLEAAVRTTSTLGWERGSFALRA